jgi:hypothetical protein
MAFSVQFAADCTSAPAPRTVLHAATASTPPININLNTLRTMVSSLFNLPDHGGRDLACPAYRWVSAVPAVHGIFSAVGSRLDVFAGTADSVARGDRQSAADQ